MDQRVIVGIDPQAPWAELKAALLRLGAHHTSDPTAYQPDAVVATLYAQVDSAVYLREVTRLAGVRYAEMDAMSGSF